MDSPRSAPQPSRPVIDSLPLANWKATSAAAGTVEIAQGEPWPLGATIAFERHTVTVPASWPLADVRLELDVGAEAVAILHSRLGVERHPIGPDEPPLRAPTRAFGLRVEAHRSAPAVDQGTFVPRFGTTRLVLLEAGEAGGGAGRAIATSSGGG
jgi:hypothetical protein